MPLPTQVIRNTMPYAHILQSSCIPKNHSSPPPKHPPKESAFLFCWCLWRNHLYAAAIPSDLLPRKLELVHVLLYASDVLHRQRPRPRLCRAELGSCLSRPDTGEPVSAGTDRALRVMRLGVLVVVVVIASLDVREPTRDALREAV